MKVLHVIPSFAPAWRYGGPVVAALGLTREQARQGHNVTVLTTNNDGPGVLDVPVGRPVDMNGVEVWYFPVERPKWYFFSRELGSAAKGRVADFDIVHIHSIYLWPTTIAAFWCRRRGVPYLIRPAGLLDPVNLRKPYGGRLVSIPSRMKKWLYLSTIGRWDLNGAAGVHFTSQGEMEASVAVELGPPKFVLPFGTDLPPKNEGYENLSLRGRYPELKDRKIVVFLSRLDPKKGLETLFSAMSDLSAGMDDFALVVAGSGESGYSRRLTSIVKEVGLEDRTVFLGLVQGAEKWSLLLSGDVFVLPSYHENFGMAIVEAMGAGLPVVISDRVNIHHDVTEYGAGIVTGLDPREFSAAVGKLLRDDGLRAKMGAAAERLARDRYSWEGAAGAIVEAYEEIIDSSPRKPSAPVPASVKS